MCSFLGAYVCGLVFGIVDLLQSVSVLAFYSYQQFNHRDCFYAYGIDRCEYYYYRSNHGLRTYIGLGEGFIGILVSALLIFCLCKRYSLAVWVWLLKPTIAGVLNLYFISIWLIARGRDYHSYETDEDITQMDLFITFGGVTAAANFILAIWFCCIAGGFSYQLRRRQGEATYSSCETKV